MTKCNTTRYTFSTVCSRYVRADFSGGSISSDGGAVLLRHVDKKLNLLKRASRILHDGRQKAKCLHSLLSLLRQQVYGLALGYEDLNDHDHLRKDPVFQTAVGRDVELAGSSTLCRFQNRMDRKSTIALHELLVESFIEQYKRPPKELVLDFDATDDLVHGEQEGRFFHGYYDHYCFLPLYVFCGDFPLVSYLRPSKIDGAKHAWAILSLLVKRFRKQWPNVQIVFRGDSGFCRWRMLQWCERHNVQYIVGIAKNTRLNGLSLHLHREAKSVWQASGEKHARLFGEIQYAAGKWDKKRRVIVKAEYTPFGSNPRYVVTNLPGDPKDLYENVYCARGDMENRIKEQQLDLFADRTSAHLWWANQFRLMLSTLAYLLLRTIRALMSRSSELKKAMANTIRLHLLKIGAVVIRNTRSVHLKLSSAYPWKHLFGQLCARLAVPSG